MRNLVLGIVLALAAYFGYQAHQWKRVADERGWKAEQAYQRLTTLNQTESRAQACFTYLAQPVLNVQGKPLSRGDLLDILLAKALNGNSQDASR